MTAEAAHDEVIAPGARRLGAAEDLSSPEVHQVYADPAGHPFCIGRLYRLGAPTADP